MERRIYKTGLKREKIYCTIDSRNVISMCWYGALILNTKDILFVDIDINGKEIKSIEDAVGNAESVSLLLQGLYGGLYSIYKTTKGCRVAIINKKTTDNKSISLYFLSQYECDKKYLAISKREEYSRARLTAKPQYIGMENINTGDSSNWIREYFAKCANSKKVCDHVLTIGDKSLTNTAKDLHDIMTVGDFIR